MSFCRKYLVLGCGVLRGLEEPLWENGFERWFWFWCGWHLHWSSVIEGWSRAIKLAHPWLFFVCFYFPHPFKVQLKPSKWSSWRQLNSFINTACSSWAGYLVSYDWINHLNTVRLQLTASEIVYLQGLVGLCCGNKLKILFLLFSTAMWCWNRRPG